MAKNKNKNENENKKKSKDKKNDEKKNDNKNETKSRNKIKSDIVNRQFKILKKSGAYKLGERSTLKCLRLGEAKLVIVARNCPELQRNTAKWYCELAKCEVYNFRGTNVDLGRVFGRRFKCSLVVVTDLGNSVLEEFFPGRRRTIVKESMDESESGA